MNAVKNDFALIGAIVLAGGVALGGLWIGRGFQTARMKDRYVTVKGVAEREARADKAFWPLRLVVTDNDLSSAEAKLRSQVATIRKFLVKHGLDTAQTELQSYTVTDAFENQYRESMATTNRFLIRQVLMVRSNEPDKVMRASQNVGELVAAGVVLSSGAEYGAGGPSFVFSGLNALKPDMIKEATARAREAAVQFATDAQSKLAGIRRANQGVFEILPRDRTPGVDESGQIVKMVRVVTTIDYFLKD